MTRLVLGLSLSIAAAAQTIVSRQAATFAPYDSLRGIHSYATPEEYAAVLHDSSFRLERIVYTSEGLNVVAYFYGPATSGSTRRPVVVFNRGGYLDTPVSLYAGVFHRLASAGFVIIAPMLRGSEGAPGEDQAGGADLADLMSIQRVIEHLRVADPRNVFLYGESRGGVMTYQAIRDGFRARAAAVVGAYTHQAAYLEAEPKLKPLVEKIWASEIWSQALTRRSAIEWPEKIAVPILIQHGSADKSVEAGHSLRMAVELQKLGKAYQLIVWAGGNHVLTAQRHERDQAVIRWFQEHQSPNQ